MERRVDPATTGKVDFAMFDAAVRAFGDILSPAFRNVLVKSLALTVGLLAALWLILQWLLSSWVALPWAWLDTAFSVLSGVGLLVGLAFLVAPVTALFAGIFLDDIAEVVERMHYAGEPVGRALPVGRSVATSLRFLGLVLVVNAIALPLILVVGFGFLIFLLANAYLLGREYFELAALRHHSQEVARRLGARHSGRIFLGGLLIAGVLAVPVVNLLGPPFATALMVHLHKSVAAAERRPGRILAV